MKATKFLAAAVVFVAAGSAFAADAPLANSAVTAAAAATSAGIAADKLNVPGAGVAKLSSTDRATVKAEAAQFVQNHKTALAVQLEQYKN
jgi:hypothetical protein